MRREVHPERSALLVVDVQPDFMPGGALPVPEGDKIVPGIVNLLEGKNFDVVVATQDWHPRGHQSFASSHPATKPIDKIDLYGHEQILWPDHCVQGTAGAELFPRVPWEHATLVVRKGTDPKVDSYSAFRGNWDERGNRPPTGLAGFLRERGVERIFVCGLARDVCVKWTAEDARELGFSVTVLWNLTRAVDPSSDEAVRSGLSDRAIRIVGN